MNGSNLIECDQSVLKEMGIKKIGDRVRLVVAIKNLRNRAIPNHRRRNRESMAVLDSRATYAPSTSSSPRNAISGRNRSREPSLMNNRRFSRHIDPSSLNDSGHGLSPGRPGSPSTRGDLSSRANRYGNASPMESARREQGPGYFSNPASAKTPVGWRPETPLETPHSGKPTSVRSHPSGEPTISKSLTGMPVIRVIHSGGQTKVVDVKDCRTGDQLILATLRKLGLPENHVKNYCFYTTDEFCQEPDYFRRLTDYQLSTICNDLYSPERRRLILRKIHAGEPTFEEVERARQINQEEIQENHKNAMATNNSRNMLKVQKLTGESFTAMQHPLSSATFEGNPRERARPSGTMPPVQEVPLPKRTDSRRAPKPMKQFLGARPPSELISKEMTTYFPDHKQAEIERAVTLSQRRSARLSRAMSRLSIASNLSIPSSLKDAPPIPSIADQWLTGAGAAGGVGSNASNPPARGPRPLSVSRFPGSWRDSIVSTSLQPLQEESPVEPNRKSYVSMDSASDSAAISVTDPDGSHTVYYDEGATTGSGSGSNGAATDAGGSMTAQYRTALAQDGEGQDEELDEFLQDDSWDNIKWMQGALIGQGSFGSVYLALHAITGELMAVKQVEVPSKTSGSDADRRKESMVAALRREIDLLRDLHHPHIVQYLGSNSSDDKFNIFLEYVPGGSVAAMLNSYGKLKEPLIRNFVRQILSGLSYLHSRDIIHRDIKGANVLVDNKGNIKISDFGISKRVEVSNLGNPGKGGAANRSSLQGSVFWMAPEVVKQTSYTRKADIWSLGCLVVEMFTGEHPFPNCNQLQAIFQIGQRSKPATPDEASEEGQAFLDLTFEFDHEKRPEADTLLQSPFLKQIA